MTSYLQIDNLTKSFGDLVLFENISFGIAEGQRIGLIAKNGTGKTTLLNVISGKEGYDSGNIVFRRDLRVDYLEQDPKYPEELTVLEACFHHGNSVVELIKEYERCMETEGHPGLEDLLVRMDHEKAWEYEQKAKQILSQLKIRNFDQQVKYLSGGQLKRVALANALITEPDLLILDEPTNHLDLDMTEWLEGYLRRTNLSLLMVTHDRYFLDRVCSEIIEIDNRQVYQYKGNYSYYLEKRQERIEATNAEIERANNLYRTELDWMRRMPQARAHKAKYRQDAFYEIEKVAKQIYGASNVHFEENTSAEIERIANMGYGNLPICIAKTQYSFSDDAKNLECKEPFEITIRDINLKAGAGFVVAIAGKIMTMPGLPKVPSAENIDINENEEIVGLF